MSKEEKIERANQRKGLGNVAYKAGKLDRALRYYKQAEELLSDVKAVSVEVRTALRETRRATQLNMAAVHLKRKEFAAVVQCCTKVGT